MAQIFKEKGGGENLPRHRGGASNPESGTLEHYLTRNTKQNKSYVHKKEVPDSKWARLHYRLLKHHPTTTTCWK